jgi:hypothetical protein
MIMPNQVDGTQTLRAGAAHTALAFTWQASVFPDYQINKVSDQV